MDTQLELGPHTCYIKSQLVLACEAFAVHGEFSAGSLLGGVDMANLYGKGQGGGEQHRLHHCGDARGCLPTPPDPVPVG